MPKPTLRNINLTSLIHSAPSALIRRGSAYFHEGRVHLLSVADDTAEFDIRGSGHTPYRVKLALHDLHPERFVQLDCDCPMAEGDRTLWCKHKVAALISLRQHLGNATTPSQWRLQLKQALQEKPRIRKQPMEGVLVFSIQNAYNGMNLQPYLVDEVSLGLLLNNPDNYTEDEAVMVKRVSRNAIPVRNPDELERMINISPEHKAIAALCVNSYMDPLRQGRLAFILPILQEGLVFSGTSADPLQKRLAVCSEIAEPLFVVNRQEDGGVGALPAVRLGQEVFPLSDLRILSESPMWVLTGDKVFKVSDDSGIMTVLRQIREVRVPADEVSDFYTSFLPSLAARIPLSGSAFDGWLEIEEDPVKQVYLEEANKQLIARLEFRYGSLNLRCDPTFPEFSIQYSPEDRRLIKVIRNARLEERAWKELSGFGLKRQSAPDEFLLRKNVHPIDFLLRHLPRMAEAGYEIFGEESIKSIRVNRSVPSFSLSVSSGIDWFDVKAVVSYGDIDVSLADIRKAIRKRQKYVKLADGSIGEIPDEWVQRFRHLFDLGADTEDGIRLSAAQLMLLDLALKEGDPAEMDEFTLERIQRLKGFRGIDEVPLPAGFVGEIRPYQKAGYDWLHFLKDFGFGGCLADDMGLGKTIQALALLLSCKEQKGSESASLIVVPKSLLANWERESSRFTPTLRVLRHAETSRHRNVSLFNKYDIILTTYGVMLRDLEMLREYEFNYVILDESQAIKNPSALTSRAARHLKCRHKLVLTGTPVENSTVELWSQFAFLNPGLLGTMDYFKREFAAPIEKDNGHAAADFLRDMVRPFILRRTKEQVAPELPERTERIIYCELDNDQRQLYNSVRDRYRVLLLGMVEEQGMSKTRIRILEGLLRLRQICNHPNLVNADYCGQSAKMDVLMDILETLQAEGHRALVFSQFTQMLKIVRLALDTRDIQYEYLDGQTKDRQERVDNFQNTSDIPFFLISLKAGGVGLNLTAADYVIHIDPWWNPAVERQASDRTHRIGQDKPVFVNKLIARDSVEEKILELQERKRKLVDNLITTEKDFLKSLSAEDIQALFS